MWQGWVGLAGTLPSFGGAFFFLVYLCFKLVFRGLLCVFKVTPNNTASTAWRRDTLLAAARIQNPPEYTDCHSASPSAKTWNRFHLQLPFSRNESWWTRAQRGLGGVQSCSSHKWCKGNRNVIPAQRSHLSSLAALPPLCESQAHLRVSHVSPDRADNRWEAQAAEAPSGLYLSGRENSGSPGKWDECRHETYAATLIGSGAAGGRAGGRPRGWDSF